jgi:hypothetical protein
MVDPKYGQKSNHTHLAQYEPSRTAIERIALNLLHARSHESNAVLNKLKASVLFISNAAEQKQNFTQVFSTYDSINVCPILVRVFRVEYSNGDSKARMPFQWLVRWLARRPSQTCTAYKIEQ